VAKEVDVSNRVRSAFDERDDVVDGELAERPVASAAKEAVLVAPHGERLLGNGTVVGRM
jgi:hypothetical protein